MITFSSAEADFEVFSLSKDSLFAVPVSITEDIQGNINITSYAAVADIVREFADIYDSDVFSDEARHWLKTRLADIIASYGMYATDETGDILLDFEARNISNASHEKCVILKTNGEIAEYPADTTLWNLEVDDDDPYDIICAVIKNGRIAAFAAANDFGDGICEVNVECAPSYRRRGFGSACAAGFAKYILSETDADAVSYVCRLSNTASCKTALRAGYKLIGKHADFVFYKN